MVLGSDINRESPSLEGMHATVDTVTPAKAKWRNVLAFMGPAYLTRIIHERLVFGDFIQFEPMLVPSAYFWSQDSVFGF